MNRALFSVLFLTACASAESFELASQSEALRRTDVDVEPIEPVVREPVTREPVVVDPVVVDPGVADPVIVQPIQTEPRFVYPSERVLPATRRSQACHANRLIAQVTTQTCPSADLPSVLPGLPGNAGWQVTSSQLRPVIQGNFLAFRPQHLCEYRGVSGVASTALLPRNIDLHPDCGGVVALSEVEDVVEALAPQAQRVYRRHMSALDRDNLPLALPRLSTPTIPVEVAMLDSSVTTDTPQLYPPAGPWIHGRAMGLAIHRLACPDGDATARSECVVRFTAQQVLTEASGYGSPAGGTEQWGYLMNLADSIEAAVDKFEARRLAGGPDAAQKLIINLSLGYDGEWGYLTDGGLNPPSERIAAALHKAACAGALVIAAAGNTAFGSGWRVGHAADPMLPGAFMPNKDLACGNGPTPERLVYAISAVDERDLHVQNMRSNGIAELAAFGASVSFDNTTSPANPDAPPIPRMTGSSFGAAGASAVAAVVWSYLPTLTPRQVMDVIYQTGAAMGWQAVSDSSDGTPFCFSDECSSAPPHQREPHKIQLCSALERVLATRCGQGESDACTAQVQLDHCSGITHPYTATTPDLWDLSLMKAVARPPRCPNGQPCSPVFTAQPTPTDCAGTDMYQYNYYKWNQVSNSVENKWCPANVRETIAVIQPYRLETSPGTDPCTNCALARYNNDDVFYVGLDPSLSGQILNSTLTAPGKRYVLGGLLNQATAGNVVSIKLQAGSITDPPPPEGVNYTHRALLEHTLANGATAVSTVPILYQAP